MCSFVNKYFCFASDKELLAYLNFSRLIIILNSNSLLKHEAGLPIPERQCKILIIDCN